MKTISEASSQPSYCLAGCGATLRAPRPSIASSISGSATGTSTTSEIEAVHADPGGEDPRRLRAKETYQDVNGMLGESLNVYDACASSGIRRGRRTGDSAAPRREARERPDGLSATEQTARAAALAGRLDPAGRRGPRDGGNLLRRREDLEAEVRHRLPQAQVSSLASNFTLPFLRNPPPFELLTMYERQRNCRLSE